MGIDASGAAEQSGEQGGRTLLVLLAAGGGSRFEGSTHKLLAHLPTGATVAGTAIEHAIASGAGDLVVITGAVDLAAIEPPPTVTVIHHPGWADGQATTLQVAVAEARRRGAGAIVVGLADQPFIDPEAWRRVAAGTARISVATYDGKRRNPVRLDRSVWGSLPTTGDEGARSLLRVRPELVEEIPCPGSAADIDTLEDLESWQNRSSTNSP